MILTLRQDQDGVVFWAVLECGQTDAWTMSVFWKGPNETHFLFISRLHFFQIHSTLPSAWSLPSTLARMQSPSIWKGKEAIILWHVCFVTIHFWSQDLADQVKLSAMHQKHISWLQVCCCCCLICTVNNQFAYMRLVQRDDASQESECISCYRFQIIWNKFVPIANFPTKPREAINQSRMLDIGN